MELKGHLQTKFVIRSHPEPCGGQLLSWLLFSLIFRSAIGGEDSAFVASANEDNKIYIWHRNKGSLLDMLDGHSGMVTQL